MTAIPDYAPPPPGQPDRLADRADWYARTVEEIIDPDLPLCDAHHHLWDHGPGKRYLLEEMARDTASGHRIVSTIFCECRREYLKEGPEELKPVGETVFMNDIAERSASGQFGGARVAHGIIGYADFGLGSAVERTLEAHIQASPKHFRGIRHMTRWHEAAEVMDIPPRSPRNLMADPTWREGFSLLQKFDLPFDAWFVFTQYEELVNLARAHPDQTIVINHIGGVSGTGPYLGKRDEVMQLWRRGVERAAACPNVFMKLGGLGQPRVGFGWELREKPPGSAELEAAYAPYYLHCIEHFGPERCMFESNFPVERASCSYAILWNAYKRIATGYSPAEKALLFHDTAARVYRLETI
ncbi:MAG: amidohydrolase [Betaproteobacteria bacterium]|nr:amidohydrolase [Betaproteobacteria bacterium]